MTILLQLLLANKLHLRQPFNLPTYQCDQIWRFIGLWATFQNLWQKLIGPNLSHFVGNYCVGVKIYHFSSEIIFGQLLLTLGDFSLVTLLTNSPCRDRKSGHYFNDSLYQVSSTKLSIASGSSLTICMLKQCMCTMYPLFYTKSRHLQTLLNSKHSILF